MRYLLPLFALSLIPFALAHSETTIGSGADAYTLSLAMMSEPAVTDELNGLNLVIQDSDGGAVANLERSLSATLISPDGSAERELTLRPIGDEPGAYTDDFVLTQAGVYNVRIGGFIGNTEVDVTFETHEVVPLADLRFP